MHKDRFNTPIFANLKSQVVSKTKSWLREGPKHLKPFFRCMIDELGVNEYCEAVTKKGGRCLHKRHGQKQHYCTIHLKSIQKTSNQISNDTILYKDVSTLVAQYMI